MCVFGRQKAVQTEGWELFHSGSVPIELIWREMGVEETDPNSTELLQPYLQEKSKNYQRTFLSNRSIWSFVSDEPLFTPKAVVWMKG